MTYHSDFNGLTNTPEDTGDGVGGVWDFARSHPLPTALVGLGLGYLAVSAATGRRPLPSRAQLERLAERARTTAGRARARAEELSAEARREGSQVAQSAVDRAHALADAAEARARRAGGALRRRSAEMGGSADSYARSHPFVVGAVAFGLGAAMGGLLPRAFSGHGDSLDEEDYGGAAFADEELQGEGDYKAAHHYREATEEFARKDDPSKRARKAASDVKDNPEAYRKAEEAGRKAASGNGGAA